MMMRRILTAAVLVVLAPMAQAATWYVDAGYSGSDSDGSKTRPWKSLNGLLSSGEIRTTTWNALPYRAGTSKLVPINPNGRIRGGDTILVADGNYGALAVSGMYNGTPITITAMPGAKPRLTGIAIQSSRGWTIRGFAVSPSYGTATSSGAIVTAASHNWRGPAGNVHFSELDVHTVKDAGRWTVSDWLQKARDGVLLSGDNMTLESSLIRNVGHAVAAKGRLMQVRGNIIDGFAGDGIRGLADDSEYSYNRVVNAYISASQGDKNHDDGFQSWSVGADGRSGTGIVRNVVIHGNVFISDAKGGRDPLVTSSMQGIGCFDGIFENFTVSNNTVMTETYHGISFYGLRNSSIISNTVHDLVRGTSPRPWIMVNHHKKARTDPAAKAWTTGNSVRYNAAPAFLFEAAEGVTAKDNDIF